MPRSRKRGQSGIDPPTIPTPEVGGSEDCLAASYTTGEANAWQSLIAVHPPSGTLNRFPQWPHRGVDGASGVSHMSSEPMLNLRLRAIGFRMELARDTPCYGSGSPDAHSPAEICPLVIGWFIDVLVADLRQGR